jgi:transglutaminase-like putative cysteine protease
VFGGAARRTGPAAGAAGRGAVAPVRTGRRIGALALGLALAVPAVLPAMGGGLLDAADPDGPLGHGGGTITAVNPLVSLQDNLNQPSDREVLRYRTTSPDALSMYLRVITLDQFDGTSWKASPRGVTDVPGTLPSPAGLAQGVQVSQVATSISAASWYAQSYLPLPYPATRVRISGNWRYEPEGRTLVGDHGQTTANAQYQAASLLVQPTARQLADAPPAPERIQREYTQVPSSLPSQVRQTAEQVTRGATNNYERAVRLQNWFTLTGGFTYDTRVQEGSGPDAIVRFLHDKRGFCVHFAFTMAAMARTLGIPARVDVGFVPGTEQPDNSWSVGLKDAHAWPELYFEGVGWTRFEPTPSRGSTPDYTRDTSTLPSGHDPAGPQQGASAAPSTNPSAGRACSEVGQRRADDCGAADQPSFTAPTGGNGPGAGLLAGVAGAVLLGVLCALPMVWRSRLRAARLGRADGSPGGGLTAWLRRTDGWPVGGAHGADGAPDGRVLAAWRELVDSAWDYGVLPDTAQTPRRAADRLVRVARLDDDAARAARRLAAAVERTLYAPAPGPVAEVAEDVRRVRRALYAGADWFTRVRAVLAPRSAARLGWRIADRWALAVRRGREVAGRAAAVVRAR